MHNSLKEQILDSVDIVDVVGERVALTRKGREYVGLCPFHDDHRPSMNVSPQKQIFKCWSCLAGGNVIKFIQLSQRVEYREALTILARRAGIDVRSSREGAAPSGEREALYKALAWACSHFQRNLLDQTVGRRAMDYARGRGLSDRTIDHFGVGFARDAWDDLLSRARKTGLSDELLLQAGLITSSEQGRVYDRFRDRLIFPIRDAAGRCVAFGGRALGDAPAKYLNSPESAVFSKSRILYGLDTARQAIIGSHEVVVVEGYMDAVLLTQSGVENVVATLGTALTDAHAKLLRQLSDRIVMCFDSDDAGVNAAERAVETALRHRAEVAVAIVPDGQDPADYVSGRGPDAFKSLLQSAIGALEFKWRRTLQAFRARGQHAQRDAAEAFLEFVARVTVSGGIDPLEQGLLIGKLADLLSLPARSIYDLLAKARNSASRESSRGARDVTDDVSAYDASTRGLPGGLVKAMEEALGWALRDPDCFEAVNPALAAGARYCEAWEKLYWILLDLVQENGAYTRAEVVEKCDDEITCELLSRAAQHVMRHESDGSETFQPVVERVLSELEVMRMSDLRGTLRERNKDEATAASAFESLRDAARRQHGVLGAAQRWAAARE